jgi:hypothetical protein
MVRALHEVVDQKESDNISNLFQKIYSFTATEFSLGIVMRFIPQYLRAKADKHQKIIKWRNKQKCFLEGIESADRPMTATSWEILHLNISVKKFGTLRKNIMEISCKKKQEESLFLSVDTSFFRSNEVIFSFIPRNEAEARSFVSNIVTYYIQKYNEEQLRNIFQPEAIQRARQTIWDADKHEVISAADLYLDQSGEINDDFDILEIMGTAYEQTAIPPSNNNPEIDRVERLFMGDDSTSVGTLFTNNQSTPTRHNSNFSTRSTSTTMTMEDVERNMNTLSSDMAFIKTMMQKLVKAQTEDFQENKIVHLQISQQRTWKSQMMTKTTKGNQVKLNMF